MGLKFNSYINRAVASTTHSKVKDVGKTVRTSSMVKTTDKQLTANNREFLRSLKLI